MSSYQMWARILSCHAVLSKLDMAILHKLALGPWVTKYLVEVYVPTSSTVVSCHTRASGQECAEPYRF